MGSLEKDGDPGAAARATILHAEKMNSKDNITCMVVLFDGEKEGACTEGKVFTPGPVHQKLNKAFMENYAMMAKRAALTIGQAVEMRYDYITAELASEELSDTNREELDAEQKFFGEEPGGQKGSDERTQWFARWCEEKPEQADSGGIAGMPAGLHPNMLQQLLAGGMGGQFRGGMPGPMQDGRQVLVAV